MTKRIRKQLKFLIPLEEAINTDRRVNPNPKYSHRKNGESFTSWVEDACWEKLKRNSK